MKRLSDFVKVDEQGNVTYDEAAFNAELDRARNEASTTARTNAEKELRKNLTAEIKQEIEEAAKLSAEEKLAKREEALKAQYKDFYSKKFRDHITSSKLFSDEECDVYMGLLGDDYDKSVESVDKIIAARKQYNETYEKQVRQELQTDLPRNGGGTTNGGGSTDSEAARYAKMFAAANVEEKIDL